MAKASVCFLTLFIFISVFTPYTDGSVLMLGQQTSMTGTEGTHNEAIDVCLSQGMGLLIFETNSDWSAMCKSRLDDVKQRNRASNILVSVFSNAGLTWLGASLNTTNPLDLLWDNGNKYVGP